MTTRDYLADAENALDPTSASVRTLALLSLADDVRRIADALEHQVSVNIDTLVSQRVI